MAAAEEKKHVTFQDVVSSTDPSFEWKDISEEAFRTYVFGANTVTIHNPVAMSLKGTGHRVVDATGCSHYIPTGWIHLFWKSHEGKFYRF